LAFTASTIFRQMSLVKPMGALSALSLYENGIWLSRAPIWMVPLSLIFCSVPPSWALAAPQANARARPKQDEGQFLEVHGGSLKSRE
jgi:hypothetical protein